MVQQTKLGGYADRAQRYSRNERETTDSYVQASTHRWRLVLRRELVTAS